MKECLQEIVSESRKLTETLKQLVSEEEYHINIICLAPISEELLVEIKNRKKQVQDQLDQLVEQALNAKKKVNS